MEGIREVGNSSIAQLTHPLRQAGTHGCPGAQQSHCREKTKHHQRYTPKQHDSSVVTAEGPDFMVYMTQSFKCS